MSRLLSQLTLVEGLASWHARWMSSARLVPAAFLLTLPLGSAAVVLLFSFSLFAAASLLAARMLIMFSFGLTCDKPARPSRHKRPYSTRRVSVRSLCLTYQHPHVCHCQRLTFGMMSTRWPVVLLRCALVSPALTSAGSCKGQAMWTR